MNQNLMDKTNNYENYTLIELPSSPLEGIRQYVTYTYMCINVLGFLINGWVLYIVAPVLFLQSARVPKSILFYILTLCTSDLMTMIAMVFLNLEIYFGTWKFSSHSCTLYLLFDSLNKFVAPIIVVLISRTCYATICLDSKSKLRAASIKMAALQVLISMIFVLVILWPVFFYSEVYVLLVRPNEALKQITYVKKCSFIPPPTVELSFNIIVSIASYAIPFCGFLYWYASVPYFLWKHKETSSLSNKIPDTIIRRVIVTVLILACIYFICWTPYWIALYGQFFFKLTMNKSMVISMYFVHLMPYISCAAYPAIFTLMNSAILTAHEQFMIANRRRFKNLTWTTFRPIFLNQKMNNNS